MFANNKIGRVEYIDKIISQNVLLDLNIIYENILFETIKKIHNTKNLNYRLHRFEMTFDSEKNLQHHKNYFFFYRKLACKIQRFTNPTQFHRTIFYNGKYRV